MRRAPRSAWSTSACTCTVQSTKLSRMLFWTQWCWPTPFEVSGLAPGAWGCKNTQEDQNGTSRMSCPVGVSQHENDLSEAKARCANLTVSLELARRHMGTGHAVEP